MTNETKDTASPKIGQATKIEALEALLVKVQAGDLHGTPYLRGKSGYEEKQIFIDAGLFDAVHIITKAYNRSLDAAKALHEAVLGVKFNYSVQKDRASVMTWTHSIEGRTISVDNKIPARAWLIAIIKALIWEAKQ